MTDPSQIEKADEPVTVANEFATVAVRKVWTRNGERLEIASPRLDYVTWLDPLQLEALTWQTPETFTELLSSPFGPAPAKRDQ
jgi:hypothetical protein